MEKWLQKLQAFSLVFMFLMPELLGSIRAIPLYGVAGEPIKRSLERRVLLGDWINSSSQTHTETQRGVEAVSFLPSDSIEVIGQPIRKDNNGRPLVVLATDSAERAVFTVSNQTKGLIGSSPQDPLGHPEDDIFYVNAHAEALKQSQEVFLNFSTKGRGESLKFRLNGYEVYQLDQPILADSLGSMYRIALKKEQLKEGYNEVLFTIENRHEVWAEVEGVSLEYSESTSETHLETLPLIEVADEEARILGDGEEGRQFYKRTHISRPSIPKGTMHMGLEDQSYQMIGGKRGAYVIEIAFDRRKMVSASDAMQLQVFYFSKEERNWKSVVPLHIDMQRAMLQAEVPGNTDYFSGLIKSPEMPEASAFAPTAITDIKAADPSAGMSLMQPPSISQTGEAAISYPLNIPAGRQGMQPSLALTYSSDAGSGWLGVGWNISVPSVSVDTRWGVPEYSDTEESEVYLLNGQSLTMEGGYKANRMVKDTSGNWQVSARINDRDVHFLSQQEVLIKN